MVVWDIVKNSEKKIILRNMRSGEILCKYGAKEKIPKEMREKWTPGGYDAGGFLIVDVDQ